MRPWRFCIAVPPPVATPGATFRPTVRAELWDAYDPDASLEAVRLALRQDPHPLVLAFEVPGIFKSTTTGFVPAAPAHCPVYLNEADGKWYCQLVGGCECPSEGHAVLVTSAIDNAELLSGMPPGPAAATWSSRTRGGPARGTAATTTSTTRP